MSSSHVTATGVVIIATLLAMGFWFWAAFGASLALSPPDTEYLGSGLYQDTEVFTEGRTWFCLIASLVMTVVTWMTASAFTPE